MKRTSNSKSGKKQNKLNNRREEAFERNSAWEDTPLKKQLEILKARPGRSEKQTKRIMKELNSK